MFLSYCTHNVHISLPCVVKSKTLQLFSLTNQWLVLRKGQWSKSIWTLGSEPNHYTQHTDILYVVTFKGNVTDPAYVRENSPSEYLHSFKDSNIRKHQSSLKWLNCHCESHTLDAAVHVMVLYRRLNAHVCPGTLQNYCWCRIMYL